MKILVERWQKVVMKDENYIPELYIFKKLVLFEIYMENGLLPVY